MKKVFNWVLAATLFCGASVFTSCSEGGDNPAPPSSKDRKAFIEHTRSNLKYLAENMNFRSWEAANTLNQKFNEYVLNNPEFEKAIIPLFLQSIAESIQPVKEGSELAELGYKQVAAIDLTKLNFRFTMKEDGSGFDVEEADDFEMIINGYNPETQKVETGIYKLLVSFGEDKSALFLDRFSTDELAVLGFIPESVYIAISDKISGSWRDAFTGAFTNLIKTSDPEKIIFKNDEGYSISGIVMSSIPAVPEYGKKADETILTFAINSDRKTHKGLALFGFEQNGQKLVDLSLEESGEGAGGIANIDLSKLTSSSTITDLFAAMWTGRSIDEGKITLLDDLTTTFSVSDMQKVLQLQNEMAQARRNYADQATIEGYTRQLNELVKGTMTCKTLNQEIPMRLATSKIGVDWWAVPALKFADEQGYVPLNDMLDKESVEYAFNILDHSIEPMQQSIITVRQLIQFIGTYINQMRNNQSEDSDEE